MVKMNLKKGVIVPMLAVDEEEVNRLLQAAAQGETLVYEQGEEKITLKDGVLTLEGFTEIFHLFGVLSKEGALDWRATFQQPLKNLVKKVIVGEGTKALFHTFSNFEKMKEIILPDSLKTIYYAFENCPKLKFPTFPPKLEQFELGTDALYGDPLQKFKNMPQDIILPDTVTEIGKTFSHSEIRSIVLPASLEVIESNAFRSCTKLEKVTFREGLKTIKQSAFSGCTALTELILPESVEYIGAYAFNSCTALTDVRLPKQCDAAPEAFNKTPYKPQFLKYLFDTFTPVEYAESMGKIADFIRMKEVLAGKSISEQTDYFRISERSSVTSYSYGDSDSERLAKSTSPLYQTSDIENFIVKEGVIVGIVYDRTNVIVGKTVCTYSASEDDGAGSRSREDYCTLLFFPEPIS